jgi:hypothetical protein
MYSDRHTLSVAILAQASLAQDDCLMLIQNLWNVYAPPGVPIGNM